MISFLRLSSAGLMRSAVAVLALMWSAFHLAPVAWAKPGEATDREPQESLAPLIAAMSNSDAFDRRLSEELRSPESFEIAQVDTNQPQQTIMTDPYRSKQRMQLQHAISQDPLKPKAGPQEPTRLKSRNTLQQATMVDPVRSRQDATPQQAMMVDPYRSNQGNALQQALISEPIRPNVSKQRRKTLQQAFQTEPHRSKQRKTLQQAAIQDPIKPGLLERDSGFSQQGPAAIGTPVAPSGSTRGGSSGGGLR
jgi:hypothetical protein